tara:strand:- start:255 stop:614 length:360 start_codon:yes stop_codon:yes gene_type:complete
MKLNDRGGDGGRPLQDTSLGEKKGARPVWTKMVEEWDDGVYRKKFDECLKNIKSDHLKVETRLTRHSSASRYVKVHVVGVDHACGRLDVLTTCVLLQLVRWPVDWVHVADAARRKEDTG